MKRTVFVDREVRDHNHTGRILSGLKASDPIEVSSLDEIIQASSRPYSDVPYWRQMIYLTRRKGEFIKVFYNHSSLKQPKNKIYLISHMEGCLRDCFYCFLQEYQNPPLLKLFVNLEDIPGQIDALLEKENSKKLYFSAGILSDSLDLDRITGLSSILFPYFNAKKGPLLEMRTKSDRVHHLPPGEGPGGHIVLSWTLSTPHVHRIMETGTASPEKRIQAAAAAQKNGYLISFHFDPIFYYPGWKEAYRPLIGKMKSMIDPAMIGRFTLGGFRYRDSLKRTLRARFPDPRFLLGEFVKCADGKFRYFAPIRIRLYRELSRMITGAFPRIPINLNMETPRIWGQWRDSHRRASSV